MKPDLLRGGRGERLDRLRSAITEEGLDVLIVTHLPNVRYLTGFTGTAALVLVGRREALLISDFRYKTQAAAEVSEAVRVEILARDPWGGALSALQTFDGIADVGFESESITASEAARLTRDGAGGMRFKPTTQVVENLRTVKESAEVAAISAAAELASEALEAVLATVRVGQKEIDIAASLERELRVRGSEWHPFPTIVASGPRSALPHAHTTDRSVQSGEWLLLDFGAQVDGYCADITRTVVVGDRADERQRGIYELVREAQTQAIAGMRPGMTGREIDSLARTVIEDGGYGEAFGHSLGHGLGLEVHEGPRLGSSNDEPVPADAVVTVEPGIYLPDWGGVRIEDDVQLTVNGAVVLSDGKTELRVIGDRG